MALDESQTPIAPLTTMATLIRSQQSFAALDSSDDEEKDLLHVQLFQASFVRKEKRLMSSEGGAT